jgi:hypothetical protein
MQAKNSPIAPGPKKSKVPIAKEVDMHPDAGGRQMNVQKPVAVEVE